MVLPNTPVIALLLQAYDIFFLLAWKYHVGDMLITSRYMGVYPQNFDNDNETPI